MTKKRYPAILARLYNTPHAIEPGKLDEIAAFLERAVAGAASPDDVDANEPQPYALDAAGRELAYERLQAEPAGGEAFVAVLPLFGTMMQHAQDGMHYSGGTSTERFAEEFLRLAANDAVKSIVLEIHSPGGQIYGTRELADLIYEHRQRQRVVAVCNSEMASAALWVGTAASEVYITPGGQAGSVGVVTMHRDYSVMDAKAGIKTTLIAAPAKKVSGNEFEPLPDEVAAEWLARCQQTLGKFTAALARHRDVSEEHVHEHFGGGGMLRSDEAVAAGMCDAVRTMRQVLADEVARLKPAGGRGAANSRAVRLAEAEQG